MGGETGGDAWRRRECERNSEREKEEAGGQAHEVRPRIHNVCTVRSGERQATYCSRRRVGWPIPSSSASANDRPRLSLGEIGNLGRLGWEWSLTRCIHRRRICKTREGATKLREYTGKATPTPTHPQHPREDAPVILAALPKVPPTRPLTRTFAPAPTVSASPVISAFVLVKNWTTLSPTCATKRTSGKE